MGQSIPFWTCVKNALVPRVGVGMVGKSEMPLDISSPSNCFLGLKWVVMRFPSFGVTTTTREFTRMTTSVPIRMDLPAHSTDLFYFLSIRKKTE